MEKPMTTEQKALARIDCPSCSGTGFEAPDYMGLYPCTACLGHEAKRPATSIDELREWALDGCPEGVSGMPEAVLAAIEAHEADKKAFSDAVVHCRRCSDTEAWTRIKFELEPFILPEPEPEPDPLVEVVRDAGLLAEYADELRQALTEWRDQ